MKKTEVIEKAKVLIEALPYIQKFKNSIFVVKYGGSFMDDADSKLRVDVVTDIIFLSLVGIHVVVVHGGGKAISTAMIQAGLKPIFIQGLRYTDQACIDVVEKTLDKLNQEICRLIQSNGGHPQSIPGHTLFLCKKRFNADNSTKDLGYVGDIQTVKTDLIKKIIADGYIPIISPIARDKNGQHYNTNADIATYHIANALQARRLVYLCDVPGLLRNPEDENSLISSLKLHEVENLKKSGIIAKGMLPKIESAVNALQNGVHRVHLIDGRIPHSMLLEIFTDQGIGTEIVHN
jgi:acetylglutamate kinase